MLGSSRESLAALRTSLDVRGGSDDPGFESVSGDLLAVAAVLGREKSLRQALADSGQQVSSRVGIATTLFGERISAPAFAVLLDVVKARWSHDADLVDGLEALGAQAACITADQRGELDRVEDELFTFGRAVDESSDLQMALTDPSLDDASKGALVRDIVGPSALPVTTALLVHAAANLRGRRPAAAVDELARLAASQRERLLAEVRSAIDLSTEQQQRLAGALSRQAGREVRVNVVVDPDVVGGLLVRLGDEVIDGSVASKLESARRTVGV
jgi:F-type H+-transporting ATPase subunit delta